MRFSAGRLITRSATYHRAIAVAVGFGVAAATAVVCGALLVGDSMRGSLRDLTLQRLGTIDAVVMPGGFFDPAHVAADLPPEVRSVAAIQFTRAVLEAGRPADNDLRRAGNVQIVASDPTFWNFDTAGVRPESMPSGNAVVLNQRAADELRVGIGDLVTVRLPTEQAVPADSPLGRRDATSEGLPRLTVADIVPNRGLGRFGLQPSQTTPLLAFLPIELVQDALDRPQLANSLLLDLPGDTGGDPSAVDGHLRPALADFGLRLERITQQFGESPTETVFDYYQLTSDQLLISDAVVTTIRSELGEQQVHPVLTYLANSIESPMASVAVPYSTITAIDSLPQLPLDYGGSAAEPASATAASGPVPLVLNSWAAERMEITVGAPLRVTYYEPETSSGREIERAFDAVVTEIVPVTPPSKPYRRGRPATFDQAPTVYNDPDLTPTVPGITDQESINDWDLPFPLDNDKMSRADDEYWNEYRLTPKAFIPLAAGRRLFGSRFGDATSLRIDIAVAPSVEVLRERIVRILQSHQTELGYALLPIKAQQLAASRGTTPFDGLFLALSFFVIAAALMLVALLFRLGMEQRASEYGLLMAVGIPSGSLTRWALAEGALVAIPGALLGVIGGVGYAYGVLWALRTWWVGAVTVPFLQFHWHWVSLVGGFAAGVLMATLTILFTARRLRRMDVRPLLAGRMAVAQQRRTIAGRWLFWVAVACLLMALVVGVFATGLSGPAQAGAFVGGGMLLLCGVLGMTHAQLTSWYRQSSRRQLRSGYSLRTLALLSIGRNPLRSTLSVGLMAVACFLIVSMSAFQMRPTASGVGGVDLIGQTAVPIYKDLGDPSVREDYLGRDAAAAEGASIFGLRYRPGQDASCNNLYQATEPQVLGVPATLADWYSSGAGDAAPTPFEWAGAAAAPASEDPPRSPWDLLDTPATGTRQDPVPLILDQNTAMWSLQMRGGVGEVRGFTFADGRQRFFRVVALLSNSVLQGSLLIGEENFETLFPEINGYSFFLIRSGANVPAEHLASVLENRLGDSGMDLVDSRQVLAGLLAVQNTYLRTFQSLGALGLLLGTLGLAVVQLRSVLERRGELALMRAVGFSRVRLAWAVMLENASLLVGGIVCGAGAALAAIIPYLITSGVMPSIGEPLMFLVLVLAVGLLAGLLAVVRVMRMPLLAGL